MEVLLERLPYEPWSLCRAKELGSEKWFGYSADSERLNTLIDGQSLQTKATSQRKASLKESERAPRPSERADSAVVSTRDAKAAAAVMAALG